MSKFIKQVKAIRSQLADLKRTKEMSFYKLRMDIQEKTHRNISDPTIRHFINGSQPSIESLITYEMYLELVQ